MDPTTTSTPETMTEQLNGNSCAAAEQQLENGSLQAAVQAAQAAGVVATAAEPTTLTTTNIEAEMDVSANAPPPPPPPTSAAPTTYDDLFPSLQAPANLKRGGEGEGGAGVHGGAWGSRKPVLMSSTVTQVLNIPMAERRVGGEGGAGGNSSFGVDDSNRILKNVMEKSGAKIEMSSSRDQSLTFLITGKSDAVLKARRDLFAQFQTQQVQTMAVPKEHHRYILGRGGAKLQELEQRTSTKISMPKVTDTGNEMISISGPKDGIEKAMHEISLISDQQSKQAYEVLPVLKIYHPFINGPNGDYVKKMMADFPNVKINIPPLSVNKDEIAVAGEKESVVKVAEIINKIAKEMEQKASTVSVEVKKSQHKYVIGQKGNTINEILAETGVFVEMPSSESTSETITLRGPQEKLGRALAKVFEKANSIVTYEINCPNWLHKYIIGRKGASIQKLTQDIPKVHVEFIDNGDMIKIEGAPEDADKARELLDKQATDLKNNMEFVEISVDAKYHKHIIGKGGSTVNRLKQERDVMINIPDVNKGTAVIRIEGNKDGVRQAQAELEGMVTKMQNEKEKDLVIENRFHRQLIGPKGENIQKIRDDFANVQISFPELGSKSDIVKLRGPKQDVDKCAAILTKMYKELLESNYQVKVPIFKQFHKYIIGKGGATIKKIRTDTNTKVDLPESGSDSDMITITGKKADVEKAQKQIQQIQSEQADVVSDEVKIPAKIHNTIIGAGGKLIQSIMDDCGGVHIKFPEANSGSDKVTIRGPKDDVEKAKQMLVSLSNEKQLSSCSAEVRAKPEHHKFLIGRQGANIQSVRDKTGARIIFPSDKDTDREAITILGTKEAVAQAKKELEERVKDLDNVIEDTMTVDPTHHRFFVNRRGEVLRQIGEEFGGVVISFPRPGVTSDKVTLKGAKDCVAGARKRIEELVTDLECQIVLECVIEQVHHRTVMGPRGSNIQKVCKDFDVQIKIPERKVTNNNFDAAASVEAPNANDVNGTEANNADDVTTTTNECDIIRITGKKEKCEAAAQALKDLVPITLEVDVPFEYHRYIIGQGGSNVRKLMNAHEVMIKVPSGDQESSVIVLTGTADNVASAKVGLEEQCEEIKAKLEDDKLRAFELEVEVDPEFHPKIIGRRGAKIMQLRKDHSVNIQLPRREDENPSRITITGYEANANAAKDAILAIVQEYLSMTKEDIKIDHRVHRMIIGRQGAEIKRIMQKFKVDIKLPREGDDDPDLVTVMGSEEGVLDCKDHLLNLEEEYLQDAIDKENLKAYEQAPLKQMQQQQRQEKKSSTNGFEVKGAPWQGASDDAFPTLGGASAVVSTPVWGPRR